MYFAEPSIKTVIVFFLIAKPVCPYYPVGMVTMYEIEDFGRRIGQEFDVDQVVLFGSYAHDAPTKGSDVDLLVVMDHDGKGWRMATKIRQRLRPHFSLDLLVRSAEQLQQRLTMGDCFFKEITEKGKVLYEAVDK